MVPTAPNCIALVGKLAICPSTGGKVVSSADFFAWGDLEGASSRLGGSCSRGCLAGGVEALTRWFEGPKWLPGRTPNQQILLEVVPRDAAGLVPGYCLPETVVVFYAHIHCIGGKKLGNYDLVFDKLLCQAGSRLYTYGQINIPCLHPRSEVTYAPLACLLLALAFPLQLEGTPPLLVNM